MCSPQLPHLAVGQINLGWRMPERRYLPQGSVPIVQFVEEDPNDILDDSVLPSLWQHGEDPFLFQHDDAPVHKARSIQKLFNEISVEELDWPAQRPDLNPIEHLRDEFERRLEARPNHPTSVPDLTNTLVAEWKQVPTAMFQHLVESLSRRVEGVIESKGRRPNPCYISVCINLQNSYHTVVPSAANIM